MSGGLSRRAVLALAALALAARLLTLTGFSLWLDEVYLMQRGQGGPIDVWIASLKNAEHPPLAALVVGAGNALGISDLAHRLIPTGLGVATVLLLAGWAARGLGREAGLATGIVAALSPFFVRYSHELRPYPYLLFFAALTLWLSQRLAEEPSRGRALAVFVAALGGFYAHYLFGLAVLAAAVPLAAGAFARTGEEDRPRLRRALAAYGAAIGGALLLFVPWLVGVLGTLASRPPRGGVKPWTWAELSRRWQFLTVGGLERDALAWGGMLALVLAALGLLVLWRRRAGWAALAGVAFGLVGVEIFMIAIDHWSRGRYNSVGGLFVPVFLGSGVAALAAGRKQWGRGAAVVLLAAFALAEIAGLVRYARSGRPEWDEIARVVRQVRRPGEPVLAENHWTRLSLVYYLVGRDFDHRPEADGAPVRVDGGPEKLRTRWPADRGAVLVLSNQPRYRELRLWARNFPLVGFFRKSGAWVYRLEPGIRQRLYTEGRGAAGPADPRALALSPLALPPSRPPKRPHPVFDRFEQLAVLRP
jgi:hypothetical protein